MSEAKQEKPVAAMRVTDGELIACAKIVTILGELDDATRERVVSWIGRRYRVERDDDGKPMPY